MNELNWTKEAPTEPGYYWLKEHRPDEVIVSIIQVDRSYDGKLEFCEFRCKGNREFSAGELKYCEWAGPLTIPE